MLLFPRQFTSFLFCLGKPGSGGGEGKVMEMDIFSISHCFPLKNRKYLNSFGVKYYATTCFFYLNYFNNLRQSVEI